MGKFADVLAPKFPDVVKPQAAAVAWIIERFIHEMGEQKLNRPGVKPLGESHAASLRRVCREPFGQLVAKEITKSDVIAFVKSLRERGLMAPTANQYLTYIGGALNYAGSAWEDCDGLADTAIRLAKPFLKKHGIIGKSEPRKQRPTDEIMAQIIAAAEERNKHPKTKIDLVKLEMWQWASSRRLSESCRMKWGDWNRDAATLTVHGMKDPKRKGKIKVVAVTPEAQALLIEWSLQRERPDDPTEPVFGYNAHSASQASREIKLQLGIPKGALRLHDSRRDCGTRLVEEKGLTSAQAIGYTGHETTQVYERNYLSLNVEKLKHAMRDSSGLSDR